MAQETSENFLVDRGGRRQIKDRRFQVAARQTPELRTGLKRRIGWDRRYKQIHLIQHTNRRGAELGTTILPEQLKQANHCP